MTLEEVKDRVFNGEEYRFLWEDPHLGKDKLLFLCLGGSYSYGTNIETSDIDVRGVTLNSKEDLVGLTTFEQRKDDATDTTVYSVTKFIKLCKDCNPNIIEMLFCKPEHYLYVSPLGQLLLDNRHLFLSKKAHYTFGGYAHAQLNKLENLTMRAGDILTEEEAQKHILRSCQNAVVGCQENVGFPEGSFDLYVSQSDEGEWGIYCDCNVKHLKIQDFRDVLAQTANVMVNYSGGVGNRNKKKDDLHMNKHMMHLIRLYFMATEILETGDLHTYRTEEHELLMDIRNGKFRNEDGSVKEEFYTLLKELETRCEAAYDKEGVVPKKPDLKAIYEKVQLPVFEYIFGTKIA